MKLKLIHLIAILLLAEAVALAEYSNVDYLDKEAFGANIGWIDAYADGTNGVVIGTNVCSGYLYSANIGWIHLGDGTPVNGSQYQNTAADDYGINHDGAGNLTGYAFGANIGWLQFEQTQGMPKVNLTTGELSGYVWSSNLGWISLNNAFAHVRTWQYGPIPDTDMDGLTEDQEIYVHGTNPLNPDSDGDALTDGDEVLTYGTIPTDPNTDGDGLTDGEEVLTYGTEPTNPDSDNDWIEDGEEIFVHGSDPLLYDTDTDGFHDGFEVSEGLPPTIDNSAIISYIQNNQPVFGLYTEQQLGALALGDLMIQSSNSTIYLDLQLLKSADLTTWTNAGSAVEWSMPAGIKEFYKVRAEP